MQHPVADFLGSSLVPELSSYISAGTPCHIHFALVGVSAARAAPDKLSAFFNNLNFAVPSAHLAIVAFCIKLRIDYVLINKLHNLKNRFNIVLHIGNFHIADCAAGRKRLELRFKFKFCKGVYLFGNMNMIAVCNISFIGNALYYSETALKALCELICRRFKRGAVKAEIYVVLCLPAAAGGRRRSYAP